MATPSLPISAIPLVISAALVLSPYPRPSHIPAPKAIIFFSAPPSSTPIKSGLVYTLRDGLIKISWTFCAYFMSSQAATKVVGMYLETSSAWEGPDKTT